MAEHVLGQCFSHFLWPLHLLPVHVHFFLQYFSLAGLSPPPPGTSLYILDLFAYIWMLPDCRPPDSRLPDQQIQILLEDRCLV